MPDADDASPASPEKREEEEEEEAPGKAAKRAAPAAEAEAEEEQQPTPRKPRLPRAGNNKPKPAPPPPPPERPRRRAAAAGGGGGGADETPQCRVVTPLVSEPEAPAELPRWQLRCMWELGSVLNFLHVRAPCPSSHSRVVLRRSRVAAPLELRGGLGLCAVGEDLAARVWV
jgi:hypothetical protein